LRPWNPQFSSSSAPASSHLQSQSSQPWSSHQAGVSGSSSALAHRVTSPYADRDPDAPAAVKVTATSEAPAPQEMFACRPVDDETGPPPHDHWNEPSISGETAA